nr:HAD-IA family hydrolase [uncultured Mogibacterium sp.]
MSNASMRLVSIWREVLPGAEYFDGIFYSATFQCLKPQDIIYERFLKHFSLEARDCFFIDDLAENIAGAKKAGMDGAVLPIPKSSALQKILEEEKRN